MSHDPARPDLGVNEEVARKARLLGSLMRTMSAAVSVAFIASMLDAANDRLVTFIFYVPVFSGLAVLMMLARRGRVRLAGWSISLLYWSLTAVATLFFGGLQGANAASFAVSVLLVGIVVGGREATVLATVSSVWCAVVAWMESTGRLPNQFGGYTPLNAWGAITVTLVVTGALVRGAIESLEAMHQRERQASAERDEALRRSIQAQKMELVGTLTAGIAHDFNNLLTVISTAGSLLRDGATDDDSREILDDLDAATSRATLMTRQLLAFGRAPSGERTILDLGELVTASASMLGRLLGPGINISLDAGAGLFVEASRAGIEQILLNLAVNARDAMPRGGLLMVTVRGEGDHVVLVAADTGVGMDAATQARIFEPFFTTKGAGTGLGLATVRDLVAGFGGAIRVESEPGKGATFLVTFTRREPPTVAVRTEGAKAPAPSGVRKRALVVEDDPAVRRSTARLVEQFGFEVVAVADGDEALALLDVAPGVACVVSDCAMARVDGEVLAAELAQRIPGLPVLLMSGNRAPGAEVMAAPGRAFVEKPVDRERLFAALRSILG